MIIQLFTWKITSSIIARGNARLVNQEVLIQADQLVWKKHASIAEANGSAVMNYGETRILADLSLSISRLREYQGRESQDYLSRLDFEANRSEKKWLIFMRVKLSCIPGEPGRSNLNFQLDSLFYNESNKTFYGKIRYSQSRQIACWIFSLP